MSELRTFIIASDIHYAGPAEVQRGWQEDALIDNFVLRWLVRGYRHFIWRRNPFGHNRVLERFLSEAGEVEGVFINGDYSCDTAFVGVSDAAAYQSADECLNLLRHRFGSKLRLTIGDHELGKTSLFGEQGGLRLASWRRTVEGLAMPPFWELAFGRYLFVGVTSALLALPIFEPEALLDEIDEWRALRREHLERIRACFGALRPEQRVILFCHDPTALPFLWREDSVRSKLDQVCRTVIGHLHSNLFLWKSRLLAGMPTVRFLGTSIRRMSSALNEARVWQSFRVQLCPALAGIQLLKDGGFLELKLDEEGRHPIQCHVRALPWSDSGGRGSFREKRA